MEYLFFYRYDAYEPEIRNFNNEELNFEKRIRILKKNILVATKNSTLPTYTNILISPKYSR